MQAYVARQPIFSDQRALYGYELLFRAGLENCFRSSDPDAASLQVLDDSAFFFGLETLIGTKKAFVNFTRDTLVGGYAEILSSSQLVVEILEDVALDAEVLQACRDLRAARYPLALDDFTPGSAPQQALLPLVDLVKVDFLQTTEAEQREIPRRYGRPGLAFLAEKVETEEDVRRALTSGYEYVQGFFFSKPVTLTVAKPEGIKANHLRILDEIHRPSIDFDRLSAQIELEVGLVYRIMLFINSAGTGLRNRVTSVKHALLMLGEAGVRKWVAFMVLADLGTGRPTELIRTCATRGRFCEEVALIANWPERAHELFLLGLFSLIDAVVGIPMEDVIQTLPLPREVTDALLGKENRLRIVHDLMVGCERGAWESVDRCAGDLGLGEATVAGAYLQAVQWATGALR
ncbi:MAG: hypothetical protein QOF51_1730 [Chloroflexota bacterium]|jgi:EAL and modified HD-GYP domain-containing signal transduction protein|nr:hypothetical protein [Chloroflexota bacterium]